MALGFDSIGAQALAAQTNAATGTATPQARIGVPSPLGAPLVLAQLQFLSIISLPSPLGAPRVLAYHDFTSQLGDATSVYVMDLATPGGPVRVPISSWQATLQTLGSSYVQCVVPACTDWTADLNAATEFAVYRRAVLPGGAVLEVEMARAPAEQLVFDRGPQRATCTLSGYPSAFATTVNPPAVYDRELLDLRSISSGSGMRVRCAVDWLLRPGHRAFVQGAPFVVGYINYYSPSGFDSYMDVGE